MINREGGIDASGVGAELRVRLLRRQSVVARDERCGCASGGHEGRPVAMVRVVADQDAERQGADREDRRVVSSRIHRSVDGRMPFAIDAGD
jgi:hypothetical protein